MTDAQKKQMKTYADEARKVFKWVAADSDGCVYAYECRPEISRTYSSWESAGGETCLLAEDESLAED